jgi:integrase/recombinase XerD
VPAAGARYSEPSGGVLHFGVKGKRDKVRFVPVHVIAQRLIEQYLALADLADPVFRPVTNNRTGKLDRPLDSASVYRNIVVKYGLTTGISAKVRGLCVHSLRATASLAYRAAAWSLLPSRLG